ncbi:MAG: M48 family metallopeptidase [Candidatus Heimdallarchaeaceae archaeon]
MSSYKLIRSFRKSISIRVDEEGELIVRAPLVTSKRFIESFLESKKTWIDKQISKVDKPKYFIEGEKFLFMGEEYELRVNNKIKEKITLQDDFLIRKLGTKGEVKKLVERWYKEEAREYFTDRLNEFSEEFDFQYSSLKLSGAKTRWGSCSSINNINLNWKLIMAPSEIIDYVILHELVHTKTKNHSETFWQGVEAVCPDYKVKRKWLKQNGHKLKL